MGLLDSLKQQADALRDQQRVQHALAEQNVREVEAAMERSFQYLNELLKHLAVLKPEHAGVYAIPEVLELRRLRFADAFIDRRHARIADRDLIERIPMFVHWKSDQKIVVERDMPASIERVEKALWRHRLKFDLDEVRNAQHSLVKGVFRVDPVVSTNIEIQAEHRDGMVHFLAQNLGRFGDDDFRIPAPELDETMLEEFAKALLGQPHRLRGQR